MSTKIVATIGPRSESPEMLNSLMKAGVDLVRINFSHASYDQYKRIKKQIAKFTLTPEELGLITNSVSTG